MERLGGYAAPVKPKQSPTNLAAEPEETLEPAVKKKIRRVSVDKVLSENIELTRSYDSGYKSSRREVSPLIVEQEVGLKIRKRKFAELPPEHDTVKSSTSRESIWSSRRGSPVRESVSERLKRIPVNRTDSADELVHERSREDLSNRLKHRARKVTSESSSSSTSIGLGSQRGVNDLSSKLKDRKSRLYPDLGISRVKDRKAAKLSSRQSTEQAKRMEKPSGIEFPIIRICSYFLLIYNSGIRQLPTFMV